MHAEHGSVSMRTRTSGLMIRIAAWSAVTCDRFDPGRLDALLFDCSNVGWPRQVATDQAVTGHRTLKIFTIPTQPRRPQFGSLPVAHGAGLWPLRPGYQPASNLWGHHSNEAADTPKESSDHAGAARIAT